MNLRGQNTNCLDLGGKRPLNVEMTPIASSFRERLPNFVRMLLGQPQDAHILELSFVFDSLCSRKDGEENQSIAHISAGSISTSRPTMFEGNVNCRHGGNHQEGYWVFNAYCIVVDVHDAKTPHRRILPQFWVQADRTVLAFECDFPVRFPS